VSQPEVPTQVRRRVDTYSVAPIIALASFVFLAAVPFIPGAPVLPGLIAAGLGISALRRPKLAVAALYALVILSIFWQWAGFGLLRLLTDPVGVLGVISILVTLLLALGVSVPQPTSMALAILAAGLMLTPQYYLTVSLIAAAAALGGLRSIAPMSSTFVATMSPLLLIENALRREALGGAVNAPPVIFSQLTSLVGDLRPGLPSLNVGLTGLPTDFLSAHSAGVAGFILSGSALTMVIPMILLAIVFSSSTSIAGLVNSMLGRFAFIERVSPLLKTLSPLVASVAAPLAFYGLITALEPSSIGGYETSLNNSAADPSSMAGASMMLGVLFTGREMLIQRLERVEKARADLKSLLSSVTGAVKQGRETLSKIAKAAPSLQFGGETKSLGEHASYIADIQKGLETAGFVSLTRWTEDLAQRILPFLETLPEALRVKILDELHTLSSFTTIFNSTLHESGVQTKFPELESTSGELSLEGALEEHRTVIRGIRDEAAKIFDAYVDAKRAFNILTDRGPSAPPVNPLQLFDSFEYVTGMKLLAEEYWLSFHTSGETEIDQGVGAVSGVLPAFEETLNPGLRRQAQAVATSLADASPARSRIILQNLMELRELLITAIGDARSNAEQLQGMIRTLAADAMKVIHFEAVGQQRRLEALEAEAKAAKPTFEDLAALIRTTTSNLREILETRRRDENKLIVLSQYSPARRVIERMINQNRSVRITDLPFQREAAATFVKLYATQNPGFRYDEVEEELLVKNA